MSVKANEIRVVTLTELELEGLLERAAAAAVAKVNTPEVLTAEEAGELLRLHEQTIQRMAKDGVLPAHRVGREWRFRRSELLAHLSKAVA